MRYYALLHQVAGFKYWIAEIPSLPGCENAGDTREEAIEKVKNSISVYRAKLDAADMPVPEESDDYELIVLDWDESRPVSNEVLVNAPCGTRDREVTVSFRIKGDDLEPTTITEKLRLTPDHTHRKGDLRKGNDNGVCRSGLWLLSSSIPRSEVLEQHLLDLLQRLEPHAAYLQSLQNQFEMDFYCGVFGMNRGFDLTPTTLRRVSDLGLVLGVELYN